MSHVLSVVVCEKLRILFDPHLYISSLLRKVVLLKYNLSRCKDKSVSQGTCSAFSKTRLPLELWQVLSYESPAVQCIPAYPTSGKGALGPLYQLWPVLAKGRHFLQILLKAVTCIVSRGTDNNSSLVLEKTLRLCFIVMEEEEAFNNDFPCHCTQTCDFQSSSVVLQLPKYTCTTFPCLPLSVYPLMKKINQGLRVNHYKTKKYVFICLSNSNFILHVNVIFGAVFLLSSMLGEYKSLPAV